ncbi:hypothetical protein KPL70_014566 [Citrus sinensis]|nr:hypothetical protein KPL70_014566 [Citrus sinensis]
MKKKRVNRNRKASSPVSPESPKQSTIINKTASTSKEKFKYRKQVAPTTLFISPSPSPSPAPLPTMNNNNNNNKNLSSISDLKEMVVSRIDDLKRNLINRSHSEILKDLEASHSRLHKRFKIQTQTGQQMMDEADKEYKKMNEQIGETQGAMKASYTEFLADVQSTAFNGNFSFPSLILFVCKTTIPNLSRSFETAIGALQSRYGIQTT